MILDIHEYNKILPKERKEVLRMIKQANQDTFKFRKTIRLLKTRAYFLEESNKMITKMINSLQNTLVMIDSIKWIIN